MSSEALRRFRAGEINAFEYARQLQREGVEVAMREAERVNPSDGSWFTIREYRLCVEYGDGRTVYKPLPPKISKSAACTHAANYRLGRGATVSLESRVVSAWHSERIEAGGV